MHNKLIDRQLFLKLAAGSLDDIVATKKSKGYKVKIRFYLTERVEKLYKLFSITI